MSLTRKDVDNIAQLSRIEIADGDVEALTDNLSRIIDFVEQLTSANTDDVLPMAHPLAMESRLRDDIVTETDRHELYQDNAPSVAAGLYLVPKVLE